MKTLKDLFPDMFPDEFPPHHRVVDSDSSWFASMWLHDYRHHAVCTAPVVAVVRELAVTLRDEQIPALQALRVLRRGVSLLTALAGSNSAAGQHVNRDDAGFDHEVEKFRRYARDAISQPGEPTRFAKAWLFDSPAEVIRTEPVIAVVEQLLDRLLTEKPSVAYANLRQTVQVLRVFTREDDTTGIAQPADRPIK